MIKTLPQALSRALPYDCYPMGEAIWTWGTRLFLALGSFWALCVVALKTVLVLSKEAIGDKCCEMAVKYRPYSLFRWYPRYCPVDWFLNGLCVIKYWLLLVLWGNLGSNLCSVVCYLMVRSQAAVWEMVSVCLLDLPVTSSYESLGTCSTGLSRVWLRSLWSKRQLCLLLLMCGDVEANPGPRNLSVFQCNINSYNSNCGELLKHIAQEAPDLVCLQETYLKSTAVSPKVHGYDVVRRDRTVARSNTGIIKGGGILIMIRNDSGITYAESEPPVFAEGEVSEVQQVRLRLDDETDVFVSNVYIPPIVGGAGEARTQTFNAETILGGCLGIQPVGHHLFIGDFNAHHSYWDNVTDEDARGVEIAEWCFDNEVLVGNSGASTFRSRGNASTVSTPDLTLHTAGLMVHDWRVVPQSSDHMLIKYQVIVGDLAEVERERDAPAKTTFCFRKADWKEFNHKCHRWWTTHGFLTASSHDMNRIFTEGMLVASKCIPRGCRKDPVSWWDDAIDQAIDKRNELCVLASQNNEFHGAWVKACGEVRSVIKEKRLRAWAEFATSLNFHSDPGRTATVLRNLDRSPRPSTARIIYSDQGKELATELGKAKALRNMYALESCNDHQKSPDGLTIAEVRKKKGVKRSAGFARRAAMASPDNSGQATAFSRCELDAVLGALSTRRAPGPDGLYNEMLMNLDVRNKGCLLRLLNACWGKAAIPSSWLQGRIIPIPKPGKDTSKLSSYRPVCLMSMVAKVAERLVATRLRMHLESNGILKHDQSGFRAGRCTADPLLELVDNVVEGFRTPQPPLRTACAFIDLSRAFDKVDHRILLREMDRMGIPSVYQRWYWALLRDRRYTVKYGLAETPSCRFERGVPQGSVSGPLLFIIAMNSLSEALLAKPTVREFVKWSFYADDITMYSQHTDASKAADFLQSALDVVTNWSDYVKLPISKGKSEVMMFTSDKLEKPLVGNGLQNPKLRPLKLAGDKLKYVESSKVLGVTLSYNLCTADHCCKLRRDGQFRVSQLRHVACSEWGPPAESLRSCYISYVRSVLEYASAVWSPLLSDTWAGKISTVQNSAARVITGCCRSTDIDSLTLEAGLEPLQVRWDGNVLIAAERARRLPKGSLLKAAALRDFGLKRKQIQMVSWQHVSEVLTSKLDWNNGRKYIRGTPRLNLTDHAIDIREREALLIHPSQEPWRTSLASRIRFNLSSGECRKSASDVEKRTVSQAHVQSVQEVCSLEAWTDGCVVEGRGVGSCLIYDRVGWKGLSGRPAGNLCSSFRAELTAIDSALTILWTRYKDLLHRERNLAVFSDSEAVLSALSKGPLRQSSILASIVWKKLLELVKYMGGCIIFQFVFSHCGLERNEAVDKLATAQMKTVHSRSAPISFMSVKAAVRSRLRRLWRDSLNVAGHHYQSTHRCAIMGTDPTDTKDLDRKKACLYRQLLVGECHKVGKLRDRLGLGVDCRWCGVAPETVLHLFMCTDEGVSLLRAQLGIVDIGCMKDDPGKSLEFISKCVSLLVERDDH